MKIVVDEMPKSPSECLFSNKRKYMEVFSLKGERFILHRYYCNVDDKECELECSNCGSCSKLVIQKG